MSGVIRAVVFCAIAQVLLLLCLIAHLESAIENTQHRAVELVRVERNRTQLQFSEEREAIHEWASRRIDLRISELGRECKQ